MVLTTPVAGINAEQIVEPKNFNPSLTKSRLVVLDSVVQASVENGEPLILREIMLSLSVPRTV
jgi:hypothetical protein